MRPFDFLPPFRCIGDRQHNRHDKLLQIFQAMAAELGYIDCCAVFLMVEIVEGQKKLSCCNHRWAGTAKWNHMVCPIILSRPNLVRWPIPKNLCKGFKSCKKFQIEKADVELLQAVALLCRVRLSRVRYTTHIVLKWIWMKKNWASFNSTSQHP